MKTPLIGITTNQDSIHLSSTSSTLSSTYVNAVREAGGLPILLPNEFPVDQLGELRSRLDGIIFSGGGDIENWRFNGVEDPSVGNFSSDRDELEIRLVHMAVETDWPFLGICRGCQVVNVALGGSLYTNIPTQYATSIRHATPATFDRDHLAHSVKVVPGTELLKILKQETVPVNSFHHQAIQKVASPLMVSAQADDGLIEGIELPGHRFGLAVQWHPECIQNHEEQRRLFAAFIDAARV